MMRIESPVIRPGSDIPVRYTCDGENVSPPLEWAEEPTGTQSFLLVCEDPDAPSGLFTHWVAYDIPRNIHRLDEGQAGTLSQAANDFQEQGYGGPCPPRGHGVHHYHFRLSALDTPRLTVPPGATSREILETARKHILEEAELIGCYARG